MERTVAAFDARRSFGKILNDVTAHGNHYIVERHGEPVAVVVPVEVYAQWKQARSDFFDRIAAVAARVDMDEDEAMALALEAQQAVRAERRRE